MCYYKIMKKNLNYIESTVKSEKIFDGKVFRVFVDEVQFPDGKKSRREVVSHNGGVCIIAVDDKERVLVEKQYRYAVKDYLLELPAGKLEKGEDHKEAGIRELKEETGAIAGSFEYLGYMIPTCGYCDERIHFYVAKDLSFGDTHFDEFEYVETQFVPLSDLMEMIKKGEIHDGKTVFGLTLYNLNK